VSVELPPTCATGQPRQRDGYLQGYRGVLGMAYLQLIAV
jgi:hypothetical protein